MCMLSLKIKSAIEIVCSFQQVCLRERNTSFSRAADIRLSRQHRRYQSRTQ